MASFARRSSLALVLAAVLCMAPAIAAADVARKVGPEEVTPAPKIITTSEPNQVIVYENCGAAGTPPNRPCTCATAQAALQSAIGGTTAKPTIIQLQPELHTCARAAGMRSPDSLSHIVIQGPTTFDGMNKATFLFMFSGKQVDISIGARDDKGITFKNAAGAAIVIGGGVAKVTVDSCTFINNVNAVNGGGAIHAKITVAEHSSHAKHIFPGGSNGLNVFRSNFTKNIAGAGKGDQLSQGGAIYYSGRHPFRLADCEFTGNKLNTDTATKRRRGGGAVYAYASSGTSEVDGNTFTNNTAQYGGALFLSGAHLTTFLVGPGSQGSHNVFDNNVAATGGDHVYIEGLMTGYFKNNVYGAVNAKPATARIALLNGATGNMTDCGSTFAAGSSVFSNPGGFTIVDPATNAPTFTPTFSNKKTTAKIGNVCTVPQF